jgi:uncharacterized protein (DUF433 family)
MVTASPIVTDLENRSGARCFAGTGVPVRLLFEALERGSSLEHFVREFPPVSQEQARRVIQLAEELIERNGVGGRSDAPGTTDFGEMLKPIHKAIEDSRSILSLTAEDGAQLVQPSAFDRAAAFLINCGQQSWLLYLAILDAPAILPGPDGSVDLRWRDPASETLVNVPADPALPIGYYGDDHFGNSVKGSLNSGDHGGFSCG